MSIALDTVRIFYRSLADGDVPAVLGLFDPQIEWAEAERSGSIVMRGDGDSLANFKLMESKEVPGCRNCPVVGSP